jgi:succinoglycan biosynthesis protein ExoA
VFVDPAIVSTYTPRDSARDLWRQYHRYGKGKAEMLWTNGRLPSWRPLAPAALVAGLAGATVFGATTGRWKPLIGASTAWVGLLAWVGRRSDEHAHMVMTAAGIMHVSYGAGVLRGLVTRPSIEGSRFQRMDSKETVQGGKSISPVSRRNGRHSP